MPTNNRSAKKTINSLDVYRNEAFDIGFYDYFKDIKNNKISQVLNSRDRNVKLSTVTYRQLNSWEEQELLTCERENREWRRFSLMDAIWLKIIVELREFGLSLDKIKIAKQSLSFMAKECKVTMPFLEFYTAFAIGSKMPVLLLIFKDGIAVPANFSQYKVTQQVLGLENHLQLNINAILQELFPNMDLKPNYKNDMPVTVNEMELLAYLGLGTFEKITVVFNNGKMEHFEGVQRIKARKRIQEIMREHSYQNINIQEEDGEITAIFQTIKKKFTKRE